MYHIFWFILNWMILQKKEKNTNWYKDKLRIENKDIDAMSAALLLLPTNKMVKLFTVKKMTWPKVYLVFAPNANRKQLRKFMFIMHVSLLVTAGKSTMTQFLSPWLFPTWNLVNNGIIVWCPVRCLSRLFYRDSLPLPVAQRTFS